MSFRYSFGKVFNKSCSTFSGSFSFDKPIKLDILLACVSTAIPSAMPKTSNKITLALFRPTPAKLVNSYMVCGTSP